MKTLKKSLLYTLVALGVSALYSTNCLAYDQKTPIANQGRAAIKKGTVQGAVELVQRLTGSPADHIQEYPMKKLANQWLEAYSIDKNVEGSETPWLLNARYSTAAVDKWLTDNHLRRWTNERPTLSVTLKSINGAIIPTDSAEWQQFNSAAKRLGIPVQVVSGTSADNMMQVPEDKLIGVLPADWQADKTITWAFYQKGHWNNWEAPYTDSFAKEALSIVSQHIKVQHKNQNTSPPSAITLSVDHVNSVNQYVGVMQALQKLDSIKSLSDDGIKDDRLLITLITRERISDIKRELDKLNILQASETPTQADLSYHYAPVATPEAVDAADANQNNGSTEQTHRFAFLQPEHE